MFSPAAFVASQHRYIGPSLLNLLLILVGALLAWWLLPMPTEGPGF